VIDSYCLRLQTPASRLPTGSNDIQSFKYVCLVGLADGDLVAFDEQVVLADVVDLVDINDVGAVHLYKALPVYLFLQVLDGIVRHVFFISRNELYIVPHTFHIQDVIIVQANQFAITFYKNMVGSCAADVVFTGRTR
jgi:hypothetical protein